MKKIIFTFLIFLTAVLGMVILNKETVAQSAIPTVISHQGRLLNASSQPVTSNVSVIFAIYNASSGGSQVWTETQSITPDNLGFYDVFLGGVVALPSTLPNPSYLQITVQGEILSPRLEFGVVPFAQKADIANSATTATTATTATSADTANLANDLNCSGCVGTTDIADSTVTSRKMKPIMETKTFSFTFPAGGPNPITDSTVNITTDVPSKILTNASVQVENTSSTFSYAQVWIEVDGVLKEPRAWSYLAMATGAIGINTLSTHDLTTVGNGNHVIRLLVDRGVGSVTANNARLTVMAFAQ